MTEPRDNDAFRRHFGAIFGSIGIGLWVTRYVEGSLLDTLVFLVGVTGGLYLVCALVGDLLPRKRR